MKSTASGWCAAAIVAAAMTASAQTGTGTRPADKQGTGAASGNVTLTGCLQADQNGSMFWLSDAGPTGSGGESGNAREKESATTSRSSVDQKKATAMAETYRLNPSSGVSLKPHVGHKVAITGTYADAAGGASSTRGTSGASTGAAPTGSASTGAASTGTASTGTPAASGAGAHMKDLEKARQVNVTAVKHISPVCEPGKQ